LIALLQFRALKTLPNTANLYHQRLKIGSILLAFITLLKFATVVVPGLIR
jgi:hypothetical protein